MSEPVCKKCGTPMAPVPPDPSGRGWTFTPTAFRCQKCGTYNNLKPKKKREP